jgi:hypothetical protein
MQQCTKRAQGTLHAVNHNAELCWRRTTGGKAVLWGRKKEVDITPALKVSSCYKIAPSSYPNSALGNILQQFPTARPRKSQLNFRGASFSAGDKRWSSDFSTRDVKFHSIANKSVVYSTYKKTSDVLQKPKVNWHTKARTILRRIPSFLSKKRDTDKIRNKSNIK